MKLSRKDQAVLMLTYEHLREWMFLNSRPVGGSGAANALQAAIGSMASFSQPLYLSLRSTIFYEWNPDVSFSYLRILRARLAIYIRFLLRTDWSAFKVPLWQLAPPHLHNKLRTGCPRCDEYGIVHKPQNKLHNTTRMIWNPKKPEIGKTYEVHDVRKGTFVMRVTEIHEPFATGVIVSGEARYINENDRNEGQAVTVRNSLTTWKLV